MTGQLLLPEEVLLLLYDDETGKPVLDSTYRPIAVAGAAILDLVINGAMSIVQEDGLIGKKDVLRATGGVQPDNPIMQKVMAKSEGRKPKDAVSEVSGISSFSNLAKDLSNSLLHDMATQGLLRSEVHGLFNSERFPAADGTYEAGLRRHLEAVLQGQEQPTARTAGILAVLRGTNALKKVFPHWDKGELKRRSAAVTEGDWAGTAVKKAVTEMEVVMISIMTSTINAANAN